MHQEATTCEQKEGQGGTWKEKVVKQFREQSQVFVCLLYPYLHTQISHLSQKVEGSISLLLYIVHIVLVLRRASVKMKYNM